LIGSARPSATSSSASGGGSAETGGGPAGRLGDGAGLGGALPDASDPSALGVGVGVARVVGCAVEVGVRAAQAVTSAAMARKSAVRRGSIIGHIVVGIG
jgi:hypothetical protein